VRVEHAGDKLAVLLKDYLAAPNPDALVLLEAGDLGPRSALRKLCETDEKAAALPCYVEDERDVARLIRETLQAEGLTAEPDAVAWLASNITGDRGRARRELEKLVVYKGAETGPLTLSEAQECCGSAGAVSLDDLVFSVGNAQSARALRNYARLTGEGVPFIVLLRALQNHFRRLHLARACFEQGESLDGALKKLSPPVFFKQKEAFGAQVERGSLSLFSRCLEKLAALEAQCKQTGAPVETLCAQAILSLSRAARRG
jgi:DNA polymerase-3 subunit delta